MYVDRLGLLSMFTFGFCYHISNTGFKFWRDARNLGRSGLVDSIDPSTQLVFILSILKEKKDKENFGEIPTRNAMTEEILLSIFTTY